MDSFLESSVKQFKFYKQYAEKAMRQIPPELLFKAPHPDSNSIAVIVKHLWGNMLSRWTDFLTADGEKEWRDRDAEFEADITTEEMLWEKWEAGWEVLLGAIEPLTQEDLEKVVYIRNQGHTVVEAINRQFGHYSYHIGQIVFLAKLLAQGEFESLSIAKGASKTYNQQKFEQPKQRGHFTDEFITPES